jgi:Domain of unknown function (DUF4157)
VPYGGTVRPLEEHVAGEMTSVFGHSFANVRVYVDGPAAQSAAALGADAFTVGNDIAFAAGKYQPHRASGIRLLAHELTHVVQQRGREADPQHQFAVSTPGDAGEQEADNVAETVMSGRPMPHIGTAPMDVQRACGPDMLGSPEPDCAPSDAGASGTAFMFRVNCDELQPGEEAKFSRLKPGSRLRIHGFASGEGPSGFNWDLSCHRANRIAELAARLRPDCPIEGTFKHGPSALTTPGVVPDVNPPSFWRMVIIEETAPPAGPQQPAVAEQPLTVVVIGSPSPDQRYQLQFATAAECLGASPRTIWIVEKTGYELYGIPLDYFTKFAPPGGLIWITPPQSLADILDKFPDGSIGKLVVYSHGVPGLVTLRYGWGSAAPDYGLSIPDTARLNAGKFTVDADIEFNSCNTGSSTDSGNLAQEIAQRTGLPVRAWTGRTSYTGINRGTCSVGPSQVTGVREFFTEEIWSRLLKGRDPALRTFSPQP